MDKPARAGAVRRLISQKELAKKRKELKKHAFRFMFFALLSVIFLSVTVGASSNLTLDLSPEMEPGNMGVLEVLFLFAALALLPSLLLMMTSFTRIIIVLSFIRNAMGTAQSPPTQVLVGLTLILTIFVMAPVFTEIGTTAITPYQNGTISAQQALDEMQKPIKRFMLKQITPKSLNLFLSISETPVPLVEEGEDNNERLMELSLIVIVPSFITSELERAFLMGFLIYLPFLLIDLVVASILMSMGMMMLPPAMISLPFKLLLFVMVDGWSLVLGTLVTSFY